MQLLKDDIENILIGSSLLGTGGGGRFDLAKKNLRGIINPVNLEKINNIKNNELIITAFMVGGLRKKGDQGTGIRKSVGLLKQILNKDIKYLIPVEIGPTAVINLLKIASELNLSVIDGDLVGFRSAPEIYVEAITLNKISRLPIAAVNLDGDSIILTETNSIEKIETILRNFSAQSQTETYVAGYPIYKNQIKNFFGNGSLTFSLEIGRLINKTKDEKELLENLKQKGFVIFGMGTITSQNDVDNGGFTKGKMKIKTKKDIYEVFYKNEYLVLLKNKQVFLTSPDSIILFDPLLKKGINNSENNKNKRVYILGKKAIPTWRTLEGKKLFSPKKLGFDYKQKLL